MNKKKADLVPISNLPQAILSMAACVSNDGKKIYVAGGTSGESK